MSVVIEKDLPFDVEMNPYVKEKLEPGFYDQILMKEHMYKNVTPFFIKTSVHQCFACDNKRHIKPLELSNFDASIMVIGETPSDIDFQTKEGKLLADTLTWARYDLNDIYFTSLIKCEESPTPERCQHHLLAEILCVQPKIIIALGYDVGKYFDPMINRAGYTSILFHKYDMITTYRTLYAMADQSLFQEFCNHMLRAKQRVDSKLQRSS
jgi:uracil-DNA glycosylase family 4